MAELVAGCTLVGEEHQRRRFLFHDGRASHDVAVAQRVAIIDWKVHDVATGKAERLAPRAGKRHSVRATCNGSQWGTRGTADAAHAHMHELHRVRHRMTVALLVQRVEAPAKSLDAVVRLNRRLERVFLAEIAQRSRAFDRDVRRTETAAREISGGLAGKAVGDGA